MILSSWTKEDKSEVCTCEHIQLTDNWILSGALAVNLTFK